MDSLNLVNAAFVALAYVVLTIYVLSGVDDILYDLYFWGRHLWRRWLGPRYPRLTLEWLEAREQQRVAVLIPAWREANVIAQMLTNTCETIRYRNYDIFVGTYPNDPETQRQVDLAARTYPRVHKVIHPTDGPTTKADNLNNLYRALAEDEARHGVRYEIIVNHDAEDIIHPLSLLLFNYLIPRKDMIQLPVFPIPVPLWNVTHWTYADEFAENHTKDLLVRELVGGFVPSAGVGTAYTRRAFELVALRHGEEVFSRHNLTEDYLFGLRLRLEGLTCAFVIQRLPIQAGDRRRGRFLPWIATQALFPRELSRAVRQKTRWNIGIALQAWASAGWPGGLFIRVNLLRDRKVLVTNPAGFLGYVLLAYFVMYESVGLWFRPDLPSLIDPESPLWTMIVIATTLMAWRLFHRVLAVQRIYGFWPAAMAIPRAVWANFINFAAVMRAITIFVQGRRQGISITWDKTEHEFPRFVPKPAAAVAPEPDAMPVNPHPMQAVVLEEEALAASLEEQLRARDEAVRGRAVVQVPRDLGRRLLPALLERLRDEAWSVRAKTCSSLGFLALSEAAPALALAATDPSWIVRANAVKALTKLGDTGESALLDVLRGSDRYAREAARSALEQGGFITRNLQRLRSQDDRERIQGQQFFDTLRQFGPSRLAEEVLGRDRGGPVC